MNQGSKNKAKDFFVDKLTAGATYWFSIAGVNETGEGPLSVWVSFKVPKKEGKEKKVICSFIKSNIFS